MNSSIDIHKQLPFYEYFLPSENKKTALEYHLKCYFENHPDECLDHPHPFNTNDNVYQRILKNTEIFDYLSISDIKEAFVIPSDLDLTLSRHIRYFPAYIHSHEFFEVAIVMEGSCINYISNKQIPMQSGDVCIIAPGTLHAIAAFSDDCILFNCLIRSSTFENTFLDVISDQPVLSDFFSQTLYSNKHNSFYLLFHTGHNTELRQIMFDMYREVSNQKKYFKKILNYYMSIFFTLLIRTHEKDVIIPNPNNKQPEYNIIYMLHYLESNYITLTLKDFAHFFNYSERQISRILHDYTGLGFTENVQKYKLKKAVHLLTTTQLPISEIAALCGYNNTSRFKKIFVQHYEMTPVEYRKHHQKTVDI